MKIIFMVICIMGINIFCNSIFAKDALCLESIMNESLVSKKSKLSRKEFNIMSNSKNGIVYVGKLIIYPNHYKIRKSKIFNDIKGDKEVIELLERTKDSLIVMHSRLFLSSYVILKGFPSRKLLTLVGFDNSYLSTDYDEICNGYTKEVSFNRSFLQNLAFYGYVVNSDFLDIIKKKQRYIFSYNEIKDYILDPDDKDLNKYIDIYE